MFQGWGFLLTEIWVLIALAALIGLFIGWLIWGRGAAAPAADSDEAARLRAELQECQTRARDAAQRVSRLESDLARARADTAAPAEAALPDPAPEPDAPHAAEPAPASEEGAPEAPAADDTADAAPGTPPARLDAAREEGPDDLKRIKGIGPKLEALCHRLGFFHFDQIANWSAEEIAWVDANLESFKGRVTRDNWVAQARALMEQGRD